MVDSGWCYVEFMFTICDSVSDRLVSRENEESVSMISASRVSCLSMSVS